MINKFRVVDTFPRNWPARGDMPAKNEIRLSLMDLDTKHPLRQMPQYVLNADYNEVTLFSDGKLTGKEIAIACATMSGTGGNVNLTGRIVEYPGQPNGGK